MNTPAVLHTVASLNTATGGPARSVPGLAAALEARGTPVRILTLDYSELGGLAPDAARLARRIRPNPLTRPLRGWSPAYAAACRDEAAQAALVHNHGLWMFPNRDAARAAALAHKPLIISPRGMLGSWALQRNRLAKRLVRAWWQDRVLAQAAAFHATSEAEAADLRRCGIRQPIALLPNGVDLPEGDPPPRSLIDTALPAARGRRLLLFLSRLHPKKGVEELIAAWSAQSRALRADWHLVVAGPDLTGHRPVVEAAAARDPDPASISLPGPVEGPLKHALLHHAEAFVLPTKEENFGIVIAEALAHGTPALTTHAAPWKALLDGDCGWWIPDDAGALRDTLGSILASSPESLAARGTRGRALVTRTLAWPSIAERMAAFYDWILHSGPQPSFLHT